MTSGEAASQTKEVPKQLEGLPMEAWGENYRL